MSLVMQVCDRITVLQFGVPIAHGTPDDVRHDPAVVTAYLGRPRPQPPLVGGRPSERSGARLHPGLRPQ
jgi:hypothetical protein